MVKESVGAEINTTDLGTFLPFRLAPNYEAARKLVPCTAIIARTFGGYMAFASLDLYHTWMRDR